MLADSLVATLSRLEGHEAQIEALRERVSGLRYESDKFGYFFVYEGTVCQVMGPNPAMEEKDLAVRVDSNGVHSIRELATQARQGGGFVNYVFPKPGTTEQPKLSFAVMITKTTFWIGTAVYIDHLAHLQAEGTASMRAAVRPVVRGAGIGGALALLVLAGASLVLERGISRPLRGVKEALATSAHQTTEASSQVANASQSLAAGASQQAASIELQEVVNQLDLLVDGRQSAPRANGDAVCLPPAAKCHPADDTPVRGSSRARRGSVALAG